MKKAWRDASRKKEESEWPTRGQKIKRERERVRDVRYLERGYRRQREALER